MNPETILKEDVNILVEKLKANPQSGFTHEAAVQRLKQYGYNEVPEKKKSLLGLFLKKFWGITAWMLEIIILLSWILHRFIDFYIVTFLLVANAVISFSQEWLASAAVASLKKQLHVTAKVLRQGTWSLIPARELVPGDIVSIRTGDFVPADVKIMTGSLEVDQSALTGESLTQEKKTDDPAYAGSIVRRGEAKALVVLTGSNTYFGKTIQLVEIARPESHIEITIAAITKRLFAIVALIIIVLFILSVLKKFSALATLPLMLVLLLAGIPVALPAMFTLSMALGSEELSRKNVLVTKLNAIEEAASMNILCVDKTGTLTMNQLALAQIAHTGEYTDLDVILYAALASEESSLDQIDLACITAAKQKNLPLSSYILKEFIPFEPINKRTEALIEKDGHIFHVYKGALQTMLTQVHLTDEQRKMLLEQAQNFAAKGFRTIMVVKKNDGHAEVVGLIALEDRLRPESKEVLSQIQALGVQIKLLTGDALPIAEESARKLGLSNKILSFAEHRDSIKSNSDVGAELILGNTIFAEIYPEDKYDIVKTLQKKGLIVGMTGDGVNDAPALQQAEVGIAVSSATDVAKKAASIVLTKPGLIPLKEVIKIGRLIFQRITTWVVNKISRTILKTGFIMIAFLATGKFVISSLEMLMLIFMTDFVKLSLATDNETISERPCRWDVPALTKLACILGIAMIAEALVLLYIGMRYLSLSPGTVHTYSFAILFYMAIFSIFVVREKRHFWNSMPSKVFMGAILADVVAALLITTLGLIGFTPLPIEYTLIIIAYSFIFSLLVNDWIKFFFQKRGGFLARVA